MGWKFIAAVFFVLASHQAAWSQSVFEDRNANGVFDGSDLDVTSLTLPWAGTYKTTHAVVIAKAMNQTCEGCTISIESAKRITVNANVSSKGKGGQIDLQANEIVLGTKATSPASSYVYLNAKTRLSIGDTVRVLSTGRRSDVRLRQRRVRWAARSISGPRSRSTAPRRVDIHAIATRLFIGPKAAIVSKRGDVGLYAETDVNVQSASTIRGASGVLVYSESGSVHLGNSKMASRVLVMLMADTVDANFGAVLEAVRHLRQRASERTLRLEVIARPRRTSAARRAPDLARSARGRAHAHPWCAPSLPSRSPP